MINIHRRQRWTGTYTRTYMPLKYMTLIVRDRTVKKNLAFSNINEQWC